MGGAPGFHESDVGVQQESLFDHCFPKMLRLLFHLSLDDRNVSEHGIDKQMFSSSILTLNFLFFLNTQPHPAL